MTNREEDRERMLMAVAKGIQAFALLESGITDCFGAMLGESAPFQHIIFDAVRSFEMKIRIVDQMAPYTMTPETLQKWRDARPLINEAVKNRNALAHWTIAELPLPKSIPSPDDPPSDVYLVPHHGSTNGILARHPHLGEPSSKPLTLQDIEAVPRLCFDAMVALSEITTEVRRLRLGQ